MGIGAIVAPNVASAGRRASTATSRRRPSRRACGPSRYPGRRRRTRMFAGFRSMARRLDDMARDLRPGPLANDYHRLSSWGSAFPADAEAIVEPLPVAANQGGRRNPGWRVRFKGRLAHTIDPLMGLLGGGVPLQTARIVN